MLENLRLITIISNVTSKLLKNKALIVFVMVLLLRKRATKFSIVKLRTVAGNKNIKLLWNSSIRKRQDYDLLHD